MKTPFIYVDMDQVLVDFLKGFETLTGESLENPSDTKKKGKEIISKTPDYWENLPKMSDCDQLWNYIKQYNPKILTAKPTWDDSAPDGKWKWIGKKLSSAKSGFLLCSKVRKANFC
jgi:hypothetical protein